MLFLLLTNLAFSEGVFYFDCGKTKDSISILQKSILAKKSTSGQTFGELQKLYDQNQAKLILLKGIQEIKENHIRDMNELKPSSAEKLRNAISSVRRLLVIEDVVDYLKDNKNAKSLDLENHCKENSNHLCDSFKRIGDQEQKDDRRAVIGFMRNYILTSDKEVTLTQISGYISVDIPPREDRRKQYQMLVQTQQKLVEVQSCKKSCTQKKNDFKKLSSSLLQEKEKTQNLNNSDKLGNLAVLLKEINEKEEPKGQWSKSKIDFLEKRVKSNYAIANLKRKIRQNQRDPKDKDLFDLPIEEVYNKTFNEIGCNGNFSSSNLKSCLENGNLIKDLDKEIAELEAQKGEITGQINEINKAKEMKDLLDLKDSLLVYNFHNCKKSSRDGVEKNFTICNFNTSNSTLDGIHKFAFDTGKVLAKIDNTEGLENGGIKSSTLKVMNICTSPKNDKAVESVKILICPKDALKISKKKDEKANPEKYKKQKAAAQKKQSVDWMKFYSNNYVERDHTGRITSITKRPSTADFIMPHILRGMNEMVPVGVNYIASEKYLEAMGKQAEQQNIINSYREIAPQHAYLWDLGYRGFGNTFIGGPTPWFTGTTGIGALGRSNTLGGQGIFLPYQGQYGGKWIAGQLNPLNYSTFQFGANYTYHAH